MENKIFNFFMKFNVLTYFPLFRHAVENKFSADSSKVLYVAKEGTDMRTIKAFPIAILFTIFALRPVVNNMQKTGVQEVLFILTSLLLIWYSTARILEALHTRSLARTIRDLSRHEPRGTF